MVVGGIWLGASAVNENLKTTQTISNVVVSVNNIQNLIGRNAADTIGDSNITASLLKAGAFPTSWSQNGTIKNVFGGSVGVRNIPSPSPRFDFSLSNIPQAPCLRLISAISARYKSASFYDNQVGGLMLIQTSPAAWQSNTFPYQPTGSECISGNNTLSFTFGYSQN